MAESLPGDRITLDARVERGGEELQLAVCELPAGAARSVLSDVQRRRARAAAGRRGGRRRRPVRRQRGGESLVVTFAPPR